MPQHIAMNESTNSTAMRWRFTVNMRILAMLSLHSEWRVWRMREQPACRVSRDRARAHHRTENPATPSARGYTSTLPRCLLATLAALLLPTSAPLAGAQPPRDEPPPARAVDAPPEADAAMRAYRTLRGWLDEWSVPARPEPAALPSCVGAAVILRLDGRVLGRGTAALPNELAALDRDEHAGGGGGPVWQAFLEAFSEADRRLPVSRDVLRSDRARELGRRVTVSLELGGPVIPITADTFDDLDALLAPGLDGVSVRVDRQVRAFFPGAMLASGLTPAAAARQLIVGLTGRPEAALESLAVLREKSKITLARFRSTHLAQGIEGDEPRFLARGTRSVSLGEVDSLTKLNTFAVRTARHLAARFPTPDATGHIELARVVGIRRPWMADDPEEPASMVQRAVAVMALRQHAARTRSAPAGEYDPIDAAIQHGLASLLAPDEPARFKGDDPVMAAAVILAAHDAAIDPTWRPTYDSAAEVLRRALPSLIEPRGGAALPPGASAFVAYAAALLNLPDAQPLVRRLFRDTAPDQLVAHMPWLGWAEARLANDGPLPAAAALTDLRQRLWTAQISAFTRDPDEADLLGGIVFSTAARPLPTWHTARALAFIASALPDPRLTPTADRPREIARLLQGVRFLRQLASDDASSWMESRPTTAAGGIRAAPWDPAMPIDATSMTLLTLNHTISSLEQAAGK